MPRPRALWGTGRLGRSKRFDPPFPEVPSNVPFDLAARHPDVLFDWNLVAIAEADADALEASRQASRRRVGSGTFDGGGSGGSGGSLEERKDRNELEQQPPHKIEEPVVFVTGQAAPIAPLMPFVCFSRHVLSSMPDYSRRKGIELSPCSMRLIHDSLQAYLLRVLKEERKQLTTR